MPAPTPNVLEERDQPDQVMPQPGFGVEDNSVKVKSVYERVARIVEPEVNWLYPPLPLPPLSLLPGVLQ